MSHEWTQESTGGEQAWSAVGFDTTSLRPEAGRKAGEHLIIRQAFSSARGNSDGLQLRCFS